MSDEVSYEHILFALEDGVATITLNRPEKMNAFHFALGAELSSAYARCDADDACIYWIVRRSRGCATFSTRTDVTRRESDYKAHGICASCNATDVCVGRDVEPVWMLKRCAEWKAKNYCKSTGYCANGPPYVMPSPNANEAMIICKYVLNLC